MKTARPAATELAAVAAFEQLIAMVGEAQARLRNLQATAAKPVPNFFQKTTEGP